jgi:hypothetical protein
LSQETPKVISIPDDKQYRNEVKRKRAKEEKNEFMQKQAEKALAKIKNFDKAEGI